MVTYAPWVITVQQAPDTLMSTLVLLEPGAMHWGPRMCCPVGSALLDSSATALASLSPLEYVLQVQIDIISNSSRLTFVFKIDQSSPLFCHIGFYCAGGAKTAMPDDGVTGNRCPTRYYCPQGCTSPLHCPDGTHSNSTGILYIYFTGVHFPELEYPEFMSRVLSDSKHFIMA